MISKPLASASEASSVREDLLFIDDLALCTPVDAV